MLRTVKVQFDKPKAVCDTKRMENTTSHFAVFHVMPEFSREGRAALLPPTKFNLVATVDAKELGHVVPLTNHVDSPWTENAGVELHVPANVCRSTSVGDVIADEAGDYYRVEGMGFSKIADPVWLRF